MGDTRKVTLAEVARNAGVSLATASKVINERAGVNAETRQRVLSSARALGFQPKHAPALPPIPVNKPVGLLVSDLTAPSSSQILAGAEHVFGARSISIFLANAHGDATVEQHAVDDFLRSGVSGLIVVGNDASPRPPLRHGTIPTVYALTPSTAPEDCSVVSDEWGIGRMQIEHLLSCNKRRIALICGEKGAMSSVKRYGGALEALHEHGLQVIGTVRYGDWSTAWGRSATRMLLEDGTPFDAVACMSDQIARGCVQVLRDRKIDIPSSVAVIGADDWRLIIEDMRPPLTSISPCLIHLGEVAAQRLMDMMSGTPQHGIATVPGKIVVRNSTMP